MTADPGPRHTISDPGPHATATGHDPVADLAGHLPRVDALAHVRSPSGWALWRATWTGRHTVVVLLLAPVLWLGFRSAAGPSADGSLPWAVVLSVLAALGSWVLTTYLPARGGLGRAAAGSPCAALAGLQVPLAAMILSLGPSVPLRGLLALGAVSFGLAQRVSGVAACAASRN